MAARCNPHAVLLDMRMPDLSGDEVFKRLRVSDPQLPVIVVTAYGSISSAVNLTRDGAFDFITKPFRNDHLIDVVQRAVARRPAPGKASGVRAAIAAIMGSGPSIQQLADQIEAVVSTDYSVVIYGETGVGKEVVARALHQHGRRAARPLVVIDCGAIVETLIDSEFFGHEKGAYSGAAARRYGCFELAARGGTIFLDEIGNLPLNGQKALLRTLEERTIRRSAERSRSSSTSASSPRPTTISASRPTSAAFARICCSACPNTSSRCRRCARGRRTSPFSRTAFSPKRARRWDGRRSTSRRRRSISLSPTVGRGTRANCATSCGARRSPPRAR